MQEDLVRDKHAVVQVMNFSLIAAITFYGGAKLGEFTPPMGLLLVESSQQQHCQQALSTIPPMLDIDFTHSTLSPSQQQDIHTLLHDYQDLFASDVDPMGCNGVVIHAINTEGPPIHQPVHHQPVVLQNAIDSEVQKILEQRVIQPSFSQWSSQLVMMKKDCLWQITTN